MLTVAGTDRVLTMNLHADQIQGFFDIPVDHLTAAPVLARHFLERDLGETVFVSPDVGNVKFGSEFAARVGGEFAVIHKKRFSGDTTSAVRLVGNVEGMSVLMFDDMITTAGTVCEATKLVRSLGSRGVYVAAVHGVFAGPALERLNSADIAEIVVTDTIAVREEVLSKLKNLTVLSVADLIGEAIRRIHEHRSVSALFGTPPVGD
jgi:ribose-phosphate pyrophosphokinase